MSGYLVPNGKAGYVDSNGRPLSNGTVTFYQVGTQTPKDTWKDVGLTVLNTNPIVLDARGQASVYGSGDYRQVLKTADDTTIWDQTVPDQLGAIQGEVDSLSNSSQIQVDSVAALRLLDNPTYRNAGTTGYYAKGDGGAGSYYYDAADLSSLDNGGTIIVADNGWRWKLVNSTTAVSVKQFGAKADAGVTDNSVRLQAARDWTAADPIRNKLVFTAGIYGYSLSPNWAIAGAEIQAQGQVTLRYSGTGNAVIFDAGPAALDLVYNMSFGVGNRFIVECPSTALDAVYVRSVHHSKIGVTVRGAGTANAGLHIQFAVCTEFDVVVSVNEAGWYLGAKPAVGISLDRRLVNETTSYCTFTNPIIEGPTVGIHLVNTLGNLFLGGTSEGCTQYGVFGPIGASGDRFFGTDFEANAIADVYILGTGVEINSCDSDNTINFGVTATLCHVQGGRHRNVLVDPGAAGCSTLDLIFNRSNNGGTIADSGTNSVVRGCRNGGTNALFLTGSKTYDPPSIATGTIAQTTVTVIGALLNDKVDASFSLSIGGLAMTATVSSADTVTVTLINLTGAPIDIGSGTLSCAVKRGN